MKKKEHRFPFTVKGYYTLKDFEDYWGAYFDRERAREQREKERKLQNDKT